MALKALTESRVAEKNSYFLELLAEISISIFQRREVCDFNNPHFLAFFGLFSYAFEQKCVLFEQKLIDVSGSQQFVYFLADLHLPGTRTLSPVSIYEEI